MKISARYWSAIKNIATLLVALLLCYGIGEFVFLRFVAPGLPAYDRSFLPDLPDVAGQTSKSGVLPHNYTLLLGDSYAEGLGDWMLSRGRSVREYNAAHVLHDLTGADVISLGRWGFGSAESMVLKPARVYLDRWCMLLPKLERPKRIFVYFYEGNDLHDNVGWTLVRVPRALAGDTRATIARYFDDIYGVVNWWRCHTYFALTARDTFKLLASRWRNPVVLTVAPPQPQAAPTNQVWSGGQRLPADLMLPPLRHPQDREGDLASIVFDEALAWLRRHFPDAPVTIVYIPSPAAVYHYPASIIATAGPDQSREPAAIYSDSQKICERIRALALGRGAGFVDTRSNLRAAASERPLHGPRDWQHFNEAGYRALGAILARADGSANICADWNGAEGRAEAKDSPVR